uniref:Uncharacterized protein n=1 Tax=Oryza sativa subsp. japonica TaxID=39947 RepID=Q6Z556_ORYSJ|nr:hypothetical protein [Oryza sativa Japonica Group]
MIGHRCPPIGAGWETGIYSRFVTGTYTDFCSSGGRAAAEGSGSWFLVMEDEAALERATVCCGLCHGSGTHRHTCSASPFRRTGNSWWMESSCFIQLSSTTLHGRQPE